MEHNLEERVLLPEKAGVGDVNDVANKFEKHQNRITKFMQKHKLWTYVGVKSFIGLVTYGVGYFTGSSVHTPGLVEGSSFLEQIAGYIPQAFAVTIPSLITRVGLDFAILPGPAYLSNKDKYNQRLKKLFKNLGKVEGTGVIFDSVVPPVILATMLASGVSYPLAVAAYGKTTIPVSGGFQFWLYKKMVIDDINEFRNGLKEYSDGLNNSANIPIINGLKRVSYVISHGTKIGSSHGK